MRLFERRRPPGPQPFAGVELMRSLMAEGDWGASPSNEDSGATGTSRFGRREWFWLHAAVFPIGGWNLFFINWAHQSRGWWFWIPLVVWLGLLAAHGVWALLAGRGRGQDGPCH